MRGGSVCLDESKFDGLGTDGVLAGWPTNPWDVNDDELAGAASTTEKGFSVKRGVIGGMGVNKRALQLSHNCAPEIAVQGSATPSIK